ncbi:MAG: hypothetical protein IJG23_02890, partial [Clostridia bacterium]|nr:hypothetical protein [Clostridia bacterium]
MKTVGENQKLPFFNSLRRNMTKWDMVALGVFLFLVGWYIYAVQTGMGIPDEGFYDTITQRLGMGDRLFVDEWHVSQLFSLFLYIPYQIFFHLNGSNDGVIIFIRIFTVVVTMPMYWYIYCKLREHKLFAVIAALLFWACFPGGLIVLNYMVIPVYAMMIACLILFTAKDPLPWWKLIVAGLAVSCAVVDMPLIALIYLLFSILCLVRKCKPQLLKNYGFILNSK